VLPPVYRAGLILVDGGLADNTAISQAVQLGADRVFRPALRLRVCVA